MIKVGDKIRITDMFNEPQYNGKEGVVTHIDDAGQIHGTWGGCAIVPDVDDYEIIKTPKSGEERNGHVYSSQGSYLDRR